MGTANEALQARHQLLAVIGEASKVRVAGVLLPPETRVVGDDAVVAARRPILIELGAQAPDRLAVGQASDGHQHGRVPHHPNIAAEAAHRIHAGLVEELIPGLALRIPPVEAVRPASGRPFHTFRIRRRR